MFDGHVRLLRLHHRRERLCPRFRAMAAARAAMIRSKPFIRKTVRKDVRKAIRTAHGTVYAPLELSCKSEI